MDNEYNRNIKLGFFVLLGLVIFITGIFLVGSKSLMFSDTFVMSARFNNIGGLKVGSNIRFNGVKVGVVKRITLVNDSTVEVDMQIEKNKRAFLLKNAVASISSDGLMGDKLINIEPGQGQSDIVDDGDRIQARNALNTDIILQTLNATNQNVKTITDNLVNITSDLNNKNGSIQELYKDSTLAIGLKQTIHNLQAMSNNVSSVSISLRDITHKMQTGQGTMGMLLNDTTLSAGLSHTILQLKQTSEKLNLAGDQLTQTFNKINKGNGPVGSMLSDTAMSADLKQSITNFKKVSVDLDQDILALRHNFLLRHYFKKADTLKHK